MGGSGNGKESYPQEIKMTGKPGKSCTICSSPDLVAIQKLITENVPLLDIVARFPAVKKSALSRHSINHMGRKGTGGHASRAQGIRTSKGPARKSHPVDGRCPTCEQLTGENDGSLAPENIVKRAERILHIGERIALKAEAGDDSRLALLAVDRCQRSIDTLAKIAGLLKPDQTIIDNRSVTVNYSSWPSASLVAVELFHNRLGEGATIAEAIEAVQCLQTKRPSLRQDANRRQLRRFRKSYDCGAWRVPRMHARF